MQQALRGLSCWLVQHGAIKSGDRELYEYATYSFLISVIPLVIFLIASGIMGVLAEGVVIFISYMLIRKFSGGYHAKHAYTCMAISAGMLGACLYVVTHVNHIWIFHVLIVISGFSIAVNSPIDSENKRLEKNEIAQYRHITWWLVIIAVICYLVLIMLNRERYAACLAVSLALVAILQLPCLVNKKSKRGGTDQN